MYKVKQLTNYVSGQTVNKVCIRSNSEQAMYQVKQLTKYV